MDPRLRNTDGSFRDQGDRIKKHQGLRLRPRRPDHQGQALVLRQLRQAGHQAAAAHQHPRQHAAALVQRQAQLAGHAATRWCRRSTSWAASRSSAARRAAASTEADGFLWNQDNAYTDGGLPGGLWKLQVDHTFSPNLFFSLKGMYYDTGFTLAPRGDLEQSFTLDSVASQAIGTYQTYLAVRPQKNLTGDGSYFFRGMGGSHELKFGFSYRDMKTHSATLVERQPARRLHQQRDQRGRARRARRATSTTAASTATSTSATCSRRTASPSTSACASTTRRRPTSRARRRRTRRSRTCSRRAVFPGSDGDLQDWNNLSPRLGMSYALDESRRTILRASYSRYYQQLAFGDVARENPTSAGYIAYGWNDANGDRFVQPGEIDFSAVRYSSAVNVGQPRLGLRRHRQQDRPRPQAPQGRRVHRRPRPRAGRELRGRRGVHLPQAERLGRRHYRLAGACSDPLSPTAGSCPLMGSRATTRRTRP